MSVEMIYKVILYPIISESIASLNTMTNVERSFVDAFLDKSEDFRFKGYAICSNVTGRFELVKLGKKVLVSPIHTVNHCH